MKDEKKIQPAVIRVPVDTPPSSHSEEGSEPSGELAELLQESRWEQRDKPFRGFDSPAGRF